MATLARRNTKPEIELRRALHRRGLRFRIQTKVPGNKRRTIDIAFTRARLAVFVDGCFWHGCPDHHALPKTNAEWWQWKVDLNRARDKDTDAQLEAAGWLVVRNWEHTTPEEAADRVEAVYRSRMRELFSTSSGPRLPSSDASRTARTMLSGISSACSRTYWLNT